MDVAVEFARAHRRVMGRVDERVRVAERRALELRPMERAEVAAGLREDPAEVRRRQTIAAWESFGRGLAEVQRGMVEAVEALGRGWRAGGGR